MTAPVLAAKHLPRDAGLTEQGFVFIDIRYGENPTAVLKAYLDDPTFGRKRIGERFGHGYRYQFRLEPHGETWRLVVWEREPEYKPSPMPDDEFLKVAAKIHSRGSDRR